MDLLHQSTELAFEGMRFKLHCILTSIMEGESQDLKVSRKQASNRLSFELKGSD